MPGATASNCWATRDARSASDFSASGRSGGDAAGSKHVLCHIGGRYGIPPPAVEREMGDDLRDLAGLYAVVECEVQIEGHFDGLVTRDQGGERHNASVPCREARAFPNLTEKRVLRISRKRWRDTVDAVLHIAFPCRHGTEAITAPTPIAATKRLIVNGVQHFRAEP